MPAAANVIAFDPDRRRRTPATSTTAGRKRAAPTPSGISLASAMESWELTLTSRDRSEGTIRSYRDTVSLFAAWLARQHRCTCGTESRKACPVRARSEFPPKNKMADIEDVTTDDIRLFLIHERQRNSAANAHKQFRNLRAFFRWVVKKKYRTTPTPVDSDDAPNPTEKEFPPFNDDEVKALLATCKGNHYTDIRDYAIMRVLIDIGPRVEGLANIRYTPDDPDTNDLNLTKYRVHIRLKGGDEYDAPLGKKAAVAIDAYIRRARARHPHADDEWLWLGKRGHLTKAGIQQMLDRRGEQAGVDAHAHRWRRTSVTMFLDNGGSEAEAMDAYAWKSPEMVRHYTRATRKERARRAHAKYSPGDRF